MNILLILSYVGPVAGVLGFIISPGLTVIYPWLREKFNAERRKETEAALRKSYDHVSLGRVFGQAHGFLKKYKWDWRWKILKKKREIRKLRDEKVTQLFDRMQEGLKKFKTDKVKEVDLP